VAYTVSTSADGITLNQGDEVQEVLQNVRMILCTRKGDIPAMRDFGLDQDWLDRPIPVAKALLYRDISEAVEKYEPRATVTDVSFEAGATADGQLRPIVQVEVNL